MIPLQVAARVLADIIEQAAHKFTKRAAKLKSTNASYSNRKTAGALKVEAEELRVFSQSETAKKGSLDPAMFGYLAAFCYGHLQVASDVREYLFKSNFADIAAELDRIEKPFQDRSLYVLTALKAHVGT